MQLVGPELLRRRPAGPATAGCCRIPDRSAAVPRQHRRRRSASASGSACRGFNALYGNRVDGVRPGGAGRARRRENIALRGARRPPASAATVLVEPVSGAQALSAAHRRRRGRGGRPGPGRRAPPTSASCATCTTSPATATTSTPRSPRTPTASRTCRSPTRPAAASRAPASSTSTGYLAAPGRPRVRRLGRPGVQARPATTEAASPGCPASAARAPATQPPTATHNEGARMTTIAFIGLGIMGSPMAAHLVKAGYDVVGYNRSPAHGRAAGRRRGPGAESIAEAVADADVVAMMVPDSPDVQAVLAGEDGVFANARPGTLIIDFSSIRPDVTAALAATGAETRASGCSTPRCPAARRARSNAALSIMVGGEAGRLRRPPSRCSTRSARPSCTSGPAAPARPSRPPTSSSWPATSSCSPRRSSSSRPTASTPRPRCEVLGGGLAGSTVLDQKGAEHAGPRLRARLPDRPAPQGPGHRHRRRPRGRRGDPARRRSSPS